jgi:hypothetical protein
VYRLCVQLGFEARVAAATALLAVSRPGTLDEIYYGSVFMYVGVVFFGVVATSCFLDQLRSGGLPARLGALLAALLALLCNEIAATLPAWLLWAALGSGRARLRDGGWRRLGSALGPQVLLVVLYLGFRLLVIAPAVTPSVYAPGLGAHVLPNAVSLVSFVFGGFAPLAGAFALGTALAGAVAFAPDPGARRWLGRTAAAAAAWLATLVLPFASLPSPQERWAMPLAVPACVLLGAAIEGFRRARARSAPRALEVALLLLLVLAFPLSALRQHARAPVGAPPRALVQWIDSRSPAVSRRAVIVVLYGAPGLATPQQAERFRYLAYGGGLLNAVYPETQRVMRFHDVSRRAPRNAIRADSIYLALQPDLAVREAPSQLLDRWLRRRFDTPLGRSSDDAGGSASAAPGPGPSGTPFVVARRGHR